MNNFAVGAACLILGFATALCWWWDMLMLLKGLIPIVFLSLGAVAIAAGLSPESDNPKKTGGKR